METSQYLSLIEQELAKMPDFVKEYNLGTSHSLATSYQYLTEIRRFFDWLRQERLSDAKTNRGISTTTLENLRRNDIMLYMIILVITKTNKVALTPPLRLIVQLMLCVLYINF